MTLPWMPHGPQSILLASAKLATEDDALVGDTVDRSMAVSVWLLFLVGDHHLVFLVVFLGFAAVVLGSPILQKAVGDADNEEEPEEIEGLQR